MKTYYMTGNNIGIEVLANNAHEAMKKAEETLLQGLGGSVEFLDEKDKIEYENAKQMRNFEERQVREMDENVKDIIYPEEITGTLGRLLDEVDMPMDIYKEVEELYKEACKLL